MNGVDNRRKLHAYIYIFTLATDIYIYISVSVARVITEIKASN